MVKHTMAEPDIQRAIADEKGELAILYREKARRVVDSINDVDIAKASLQQKSISSGVLLDKSLLLSGDLPQVSVTVLLDLMTAARDMRDAEDARFQAEFRATHKPATITAGQ
jgi:hypothetical protein